MTETEVDAFRDKFIFLLRINLMTSIEINTTTPNPRIIFRVENDSSLIPNASRIVGIWTNKIVNTS